MRFFEILFEDIWSDIATKWSDKENIPLDQVELYINKYKQLKQKNMFDNPEHKDIQHIYKNMDFLEFKQLVDQAEIKANQTKGAIRSKIKNSKNAIVYRDDSDWLIVVPKNKETSQNIGTETTWCTASRGDNYFDRYTIEEHGTMVYLINKHEEQKLSNDKSKYAIRFEDETGNMIEIENAPQEPHILPEKRFTNETGFNPHEIVALIRNSSEWKNYYESKYENLSLFDLIQNGKTDLVKKKIESGADVNAKNNNGNTPLCVASSNEHIEIVKLLLEYGADVNAKNNYGSTPLYLASECGHTEIVKLLLEYGADVNEYTPLYWASYKGHAEIVKLLLEYGADVNIKDNDGRTPLYWASVYGYTEIVKLLLEYGADVNVKSNSNNRNTALYLASGRGHTEIVKLLLEYGADVNAKDRYGNTPLYGASYKGYTEIVKLLLAHGADVNIKNNGGCSPLYLASTHEYTEVVKLLKQYGA